MTTIRTRLGMAALIIIVGAGVPLLSGCSSAVQGAVEQAAGNAIGGDVNISSDGLSVTDSNGNEIQVGGDVTLPDNWPAEVPTVDGGKLVTVMVAGDGASVNAMWTTEASTADTAASYSSALTAAGYTQEQTSAAGDIQNSQWLGNGYRVNVMVSGADGTTSVLVNAEKAASPSAS